MGIGRRQVLGAGIGAVAAIASSCTNERGTPGTPGTAVDTTTASALTTPTVELWADADFVGFVALDTAAEDVIGSDWAKGSSTAGVTVQHLLTMTSGLDDTFQVQSEPGEAWLYSGAFSALFDVLTTSTGMELQELGAQWLFGPAGADTAEFRVRRISGFAPVGLRASAADLIAIGQAVVEGSQPGLDPTWLDDSFAPSQDHNQGYGYLWWLNGHESYLLPGPRAPKRDGPIIPPAPNDLVAALGKDDQKLYLSRNLQLVVARLGEKAVQGAPALSTFDPDLWKRLTELRGGS